VSNFIKVDFFLNTTGLALLAISFLSVGI